MLRACDVCQKQYQAKRESSRYCSDTCRKRAQRGTSLAPVVDFVMLPDHLGGSAGGLVAATMAELDVAGVLNTSRGQGALVLARRLEAGGLDTGSSVAAMVAGLRAAMDSALDSAVAVDDPLDMLAKKRVERLAHG